MSRELRSNLVTEYGITRGLAIGLASGVVMVLVTLALRLTVSSSSITELAADWFTSVLPGPAIDFLLESLSFSAKPLMFASLLVVQVIVGGVLGMAFVAVVNRWSYYDVDLRLFGTGYGIVLWLIGMVTLVPIFGGGFFASSVPGGIVNFIIFSLVPFLSYGLSVGFLLSRIGQGDSVTDGIDRREFLKKAGVIAGIAVVVLLGAQFIFDRMREMFSPSRSLRTLGVLSTEVTPNEEFYVVSKNIIDPTINSDEWQLEIRGLVNNSFTLTYDELLTLPSVLVEEFVTLECISNTVGGDLIGNARWNRQCPVERCSLESHTGYGWPSTRGRGHIFHGWRRL